MNKAKSARTPVSTEFQNYPASGSHVAAEVGRPTLQRGGWGRSTLVGTYLRSTTIHTKKFSLSVSGCSAGLPGVCEKGLVLFTRGSLGSPMFLSICYNKLVLLYSLNNQWLLNIIFPISPIPTLLCIKLIDLLKGKKHKKRQGCQLLPSVIILNPGISLTQLQTEGNSRYGIM